MRQGTKITKPPAWILGTVLLASLPLIGNAQPVTVTTTADTGAGSLRYALSGGTTPIINFAPGLTGTIALASPLPPIKQNTTIQGPGASALTISGSGLYQIFSIVGPAGQSLSVTISGLTIANGNASTFYTADGTTRVFGGGAIQIAPGSTVTVNGCTFSNNTDGSTILQGGAIANFGTLIVTNSTFVGNTDDGYGGGAIYSGLLFQGTTPGTATVTNTTFSGNSSTFGGGAILNNTGTLTVTNTAFVGNSGAYPSAIYSSGGSITENNNLFYNNSGQAYNLTPSASDITGQNPLLLPLGYYGGPTPTMPPQPGSPAICAGTSTPANATLPTTDQRGFLVNTSCVDIGSVQTNYMIVNTTADSTDGSCGSPCSLRDAIIQANGNTSGDIVFSNGLSGTITLGTSALTITGQLLLLGPGANNLTISGGSQFGNQFGIFNIANGASATFRGLTMTQGYLPSGGAILNNGTLAITDCTLSYNVANGPGGAIGNYGTLTATNTLFQGNSANSYGGAILNSSITSNLQPTPAPAVATITNSTFWQNAASKGGGAILNFPYFVVECTGSCGGFGTEISTLAVTNSTFFSNGADVEGGAIDNYAILTVSDSTFAANNVLSSYGGGINQASEAEGGFYAAMTVTNSIFSRNTAATGDGGGIAVQFGTFSEQYNLYYNNTGGDASGFTLAATDITGQDPMLAPIGSNGGPTPTILPLPGAPSGSPAICAGSASLIPAGTPNDQRGFPRTTTYTVNGTPTTCLDLGAAQTHYQSVQITNIPTNGYLALAGTVVTPAPIVSVTENGQNTGGIPVTLTFSGNGTASGLGPVTTVAGTGATFGALSVNAQGNDTLSAVLNLNPPTATPALSISSNTATLTIDTAQPPSVTNVTTTSANGAYGIGAVIPITITFTNPVIVTGTPQLALSTGGTAIYSFAAGSALTFIYTVGAGQSGLLDVASSTALTVNGGTITDTYGDAANLTLPAPGSAGSLGANSSITIYNAQVNSSSLKVTENGALYSPYLYSSYLVLNRSSAEFVWSGGVTSSFTVTNTSASTIPGPIQLVLSGPVSVFQPEGDYLYLSPLPSVWTVTSNSLAPGASATVVVQVSSSPGTAVSLTPTVLSGGQ